LVGGLGLNRGLIEPCRAPHIAGDSSADDRGRFHVTFLRRDRVLQVAAICREDAKGPPVVIRSDFHQTMYSLAVSAPFNIFVVIIVIINTVQMIMLTSPYAQAMHGTYCSML